MDTFITSPAPADRLVRFVGDSIPFSISRGPDANPANGWTARLRTTLGRSRTAREEIIRAHVAKLPAFGARWHDIPLAWDGSRWSREIVLAETGYALAKPYLIDPKGYQHWPAGPDIGISVHPDWTRTANTLYCAFTRLFGTTRTASRLRPEPAENTLRDLERQGFATLPPSGTFRDLTRQLPHIVSRLGCRILHLLPIHPTPTTFARFGRYGSPYAALDLTTVDPALVEFDRATTGIQQFEELTRATHRLGARVFLDVVLNHTGWGSRLHEEHPEYFRRESGNHFASPGAWGVVWEDLVELEPHDVALWDLLAEALLTWCRRGVDGFRCDAGYKIPTHVWQYITARIHSEFPDTVLLLEGLGGPWEATDQLLTEGGMQWAYSELFQNHSPGQVQWYLDHALRQSHRFGTYVHYSETHDNDRLAAQGGRPWSLLRNRLCALTSVNGAFGFTCGVEWLAQEKILVHQRTGLAWDSPDAIVDELATLNTLLANHPAFFDGAELTRLSPDTAPAYALLRQPATQHPPILVLINPSTLTPASLSLPSTSIPGLLTHNLHDLLGQPTPTHSHDPHHTTFNLPPASAYALSPEPPPAPAFGADYRAHRARVAWAVQAAARLAPPETITRPDPATTSRLVAENPARWLALLSETTRTPNRPKDAPIDFTDIAARWTGPDPFPNTVVWQPRDARRTTLIPPDWWLIVLLDSPFRAHLACDNEPSEQHAASIPVDHGHVVAFPPRNPSAPASARLRIDSDSDSPAQPPATLRFLANPQDGPSPAAPIDPDSLVLLTNHRGGMARLRVHLGSVRSKYDAALAANLHPAVPVDRHVLAKRVRAWVDADGFLSALDASNLVEFQPGPPPTWTFRANAGDGRSVVISLQAVMPQDRNTVVFRWTRSETDAPIRATLTLRVDLEDRGFHAETRRNPAADHHFSHHLRSLQNPHGFEFIPAPDRRLRVSCTSGTYHPQPEWSEHVPHPIEASRGQVAQGDAFSPGWFEVPLPQGSSPILVLDAEPNPIPSESAARLLPVPQPTNPPPTNPANPLPSPPRPLVSCPGFPRQLALALEAFVVRRNDGHTVIAGYPWFLDWGRDTLIAARGLTAAGWSQEVDGILRVFARFAHHGTLPNSIHGDNASNRDTSDAPLWFIRGVEEAAATRPPEFLRNPVTPRGQSLIDVARSLAQGYLAGTPNGIRVDPETGLVWSPAHFTWMDTNHPAGTPREGYPVEIQALWIGALRFLARHDDPRLTKRWEQHADLATTSFRRLFWIEARGWFADVLRASPGTPALQATPDTALRCNALLAVTLGLATESQARRVVDAALRHLLVPGALRSLAPLPVSPPLPIHAADGRLLNDPDFPYQGRYEGDEDTRRKPAYHNGTAWTWFLPIFCEALASAWNFRPEARLAARAILATAADLLPQGCIGHLPEVLDGDTPHTPRGCDAQAWSATECLRVWRILSEPSESDPSTQ